MLVALWPGFIPGPFAAELWIAEFIQSRDQVDLAAGVLVAERSCSGSSLMMLLPTTSRRPARKSARQACR
jgi:hypothetical protein